MRNAVTSLITVYIQLCSMPCHIIIPPLTSGGGCIGDSISQSKVLNLTMIGSCLILLKLLFQSLFVIFLLPHCLLEPMNLALKSLFLILQAHLM